MHKHTISATRQAVYTSRRVDRLGEDSEETAKDAKDPHLHVHVPVRSSVVLPCNSPPHGASLASVPGLPHSVSVFIMHMQACFECFPHAHKTCMERGRPGTKASASSHQPSLWEESDDQLFPSSQTHPPVDIHHTYM